MTIVLIDPKRITVPRPRQELGDIDALAWSIEDVGLLFPLIVDPEYNLIAGRRRLAAVGLLGWKQVMVRVMPLDDDKKIQAEFDENELRKELTPSEKMDVIRDLQEAWPDMTVEEAAARVGLKRRSYFHTKQAVEQGTPEVVEAMDKGELAVSTAAEISKLPAEQQPLAVAVAVSKNRGRPPKVKPEAKQQPGAEPVPDPETVKQAEPEQPPPIPAHLAAAFNDQTLESLLAELTRIKTTIKSVGRWNQWLNLSASLDALESLRSCLKGSRPASVCPDCKGTEGGCQSCRKQGWVPDWRLEELKL